jgi:3-hydroxyacyl-CoA dehydrogenase
MTETEKEGILQRLSTTIKLEDFGKCDFIIEAAVENIPLKWEIFTKLDEVTPRETILASNTSYISITRIASVTRRPDRVVGMHFFNPAPVMKLIEIIRGLVTSDETFRITHDLSLKLGKTPLEANDFPGFISSRLIFSFMNEGICTLYEGLGRAEDIDVIMKMVDVSCARTGWLILNTHDIDERPSPYGCAPEFLEAAARYALDSGAEILPVDEVWARLDAGAETGSAGPGEP